MTFAKAHALLIGIDGYAHRPELGMPSWAADARALAAVLCDPAACGYLAAQITLLAGRAASREAVLAALDSLATRTNAEDTVLIFYAGQGAYGDEGYYLTTYDTRWREQKVVDGSGVSGVDLVTRLQAIKARHVLLLVSTRHAEQEPAGESLPPELAAALIGTGEGRVIISACREDQRAYAGPGPITLFAQALVDGLQGKGVRSNGGWIAVFDLYTHLYFSLDQAVPRQVSSELRTRWGAVQEPELTLLRGAAPFPIALYRGADPGGTFDDSGRPADGTAVCEVNPAYAQAMLLQYRRDASTDEDRAVRLAAGATDAPRSPASGRAPGAVDFGDGQFGDVTIGDVTQGDRVSAGDLRGSSLAVGSGARAEVHTINTQGDYVAGDIDRRTGTFISGGRYKLAGVQAAQVTIDGRQYISVSQTPRTANDRNRESLLDKVYQFWVRDFLASALHEVVRIELGLETRPEVVHRPLEALVRLPEREAEVLPPGVAMVEVFDRAGGALLILGAPGAGKTTSLIELARDLIERARHDPAHPIPVVFNLSSWAQRKLSFVQWLSDELHRRYDIPRRLARTWLADDGILPLLDGLDEVPEEAREACVAAINSYRGAHGLTPIAICSRLADYQALGAQLRLTGAVLIQPLSDEQVASYLKLGGEQLAGLRAALAADSTLRELAETPLMLGIMSLAYQGEPAAAPLIQDAAPEERRRRLFDTYIARMFARRRPDPRFPQERAMSWLRWLAHAMQSRAQSVFYIEDSQPDLLDKPWMFTALLATLAGSLISIASLIGLFLLPLVGGTAPANDELDELSVIFAINTGAAALLVVVFQVAVTMLRLRHRRWFVALLASLLSVPLGITLPIPFIITVYYFLRQRQQGAGPALWVVPIRPVEALSWSWRRGLVWWSGALLVANLVIAGFALLRRGDWSEQAMLGLASAILGALGGSLLIGFLGGLARNRIEDRQHVNQGMWRSARSATLSVLALVAVGLLVTALLALGAWALTSREGSRDVAQVALLYMRDSSSVVVSAVPLLLLLCAWWNGGWALLKHYVLRMVLWRRGALPWDLAAFLRFSEERLLLRRAGGGYLWIHRLLLEHVVATSAAVPAIPPPVESLGQAGPTAPDGNVARSYPVDTHQRAGRAKSQPPTVLATEGERFDASQAGKLTLPEVDAAVRGEAEPLWGLAPRLTAQVARARALLARLLLAGALLSTLALAAGFWRVQTSIYASLRHSLTGHTAEVRHMKFSPDGRLLAAWAADGTIRVWSTVDGGPLGLIDPTQGDSFQGADDEEFLAWSPDGELIATKTITGGVQLWRSADGGLEQYVSPPVGRIGTVAASRSGDYALAVSGGWTRIWRVHDGALISSIEGSPLAVSTAADRFALRDGNGERLKLYDLTSGGLSATLVGHEAQISRARFSADGRLIVTEATDTTVRVWSVKDGTLLHTFAEQRAKVAVLALSQDGTVLATQPEDGQVQIADTTSGLIRRTFTAHETVLSAMQLSPDGELLASIAEDWTLKLWRTATGEQLKVGGLDQLLAEWAVFSPDGSVLAVGASYDGVELYAMPEGRLIGRLESGATELRGLRFLDAGKSLLVLTIDGQAQLWQLENATLKAVLDNVISVASLPDGTLLTGGRGVLALRAGDDGRILRVVAEGPVAHARALQFAPDGATLLIEDGSQLHLWSVTEGRLISTLPQGQNPSSVRFLSANRLLARYPSDWWVLFDVEGTFIAEGQASAIGWSQRGELLAVGDSEWWPGMWLLRTSDGSIITEDVELERPKGFEFSPDEQLLAFTVQERLLLLRTADGGLVADLGASDEVAFAPDSRLLATRDGRRVSLLDTSDGAVLQSFTTVITPTNRLMFSPGGEYLVIWNSNDAEIRRASDGALIAVVRRTSWSGTWSGGEPVFMPDGRHLRRGFVYIRLEDGAVVYRDPPYDGIDGKNAAFASGMRADLAPDGRTVRLWRLGPP